MVINNTHSQNIHFYSLVRVLVYAFTILSMQFYILLKSIIIASLQLKPADLEYRPALLTLESLQ